MLSSLILNKEEEDYDPEDPGTWYTVNDLAHDYRCANEYKKSAKLYYYLAMDYGDPNIISWLLSESIDLDGERREVIASIIALFKKWSEEGNDD